MELIQGTLIALEAVAIVAIILSIVALLREEWAERHSPWAGWEDLPVRPLQPAEIEAATARIDADLERQVAPPAAAAADNYLHLAATWRNQMGRGIDPVRAFGRHASGEVAPVSPAPHVGRHAYRLLAQETGAWPIVEASRELVGAGAR